MTNKNEKEDLEEIEWDFWCETFHTFTKCKLLKLAYVDLLFIIYKLNFKMAKAILKISIFDGEDIILA